jgi:hypothetical protein
VLKRLRDWASEERMAPEPYSFLPAPDTLPSDPPDPPTAGWWKDPLSSNEVTQRYFDGTIWTPFILVRTAKSWTQIFPDGVNTQVDPDALGIPRPPANPEPAPDPPRTPPGHPSARPQGSYPGRESLPRRRQGTRS